MSENSGREMIEIHEHPWFNEQYHQAIWVLTWASTGTNDVPPYDAPISCSICGRLKETNNG